MNNPTSVCSVGDDTLRVRLGASRTVPRSTVRVSVEVVAQVCAEDAITQQAAQRAARFTGPTGWPWRLGEIRCGLRADWNGDCSPTRVGRQSAMAGCEGGMGLPEPRLLVTDAMLRAPVPD